MQLSPISRVDLQELVHMIGRRLLCGIILALCSLLLPLHAQAETKSQAAFCADAAFDAYTHGP